MAYEVIKSCTPGITDYEMRSRLNESTYQAFISYERLLTKSIYDCIAGKRRNESLFALKMTTDGIAVYLKLD